VPHGLLVPERSADKSRGPYTVGETGVTSMVGADSLSTLGTGSSGAMGLGLTGKGTIPAG
jgi:hypothetical protein